MNRPKYSFLKYRKNGRFEFIRDKMNTGPRKYLNLSNNNIFLTVC